MTKDKGGRPTKMTPLTVAKLEEAFCNDMTDEEACLHAGIDKSTLYRYQEKNEDFRDRKELLKNSLALHAKNNIAKGIHDGAKDITMWWLERRRKQDYSQRSEQEVQVNLNVGLDDKDIIGRFVGRNK